jgi:hypothetical protein
VAEGSVTAGFSDVAGLAVPFADAQPVRTSELARIMAASSIFIDKHLESIVLPQIQ